MDHEMMALASNLAERFGRSGRKLVTAESCTGGGLAHALTMVPGSSAWFERGFVVYSNESKHDMLNVPRTIIAEHGAVSEPVARAMAEGALSVSHADVAVAITGIAGPGGGTPTKPVGTVFIACAGKRRATQCEQLALRGDRESICNLSINQAMQKLLAYVD